MNEAPRIGDLIEKYRARWVITGTANGYAVQRRRTDGQRYGEVLRAHDIPELARVLAEAEAAK